MSVTARSLGNMQVEIQAGPHTILADEPPSAGGDDAGPAPYDLLLSGLAACKIMTVRMYAERKQWVIDEITLTLEHRKVSAADCEDCDSPPTAKVDIIDGQIYFEGDLDEAQKARLAQIADRCPVHRSLTSETKIHTTLQLEPGVQFAEEVSVPA